MFLVFNISHICDSSSDVYPWAIAHTLPAATEREACMGFLPTTRNISTCPDGDWQIHKYNILSLCRGLGKTLEHNSCCRDFVGWVRSYPPKNFLRGHNCARLLPFSCPDAPTSLPASLGSTSWVNQLYMNLHFWVYIWGTQHRTTLFGIITKTKYVLNFLGWPLIKVIVGFHNQNMSGDYECHMDRNILILKTYHSRMWGILFQIRLLFQENMNFPSYLYWKQSKKRSPFMNL